MTIETSPQTDTPQSTNAWDTPLDLDVSSPIANVEPHIGWLKELGLDFGWGPTAMMQWYLEHIYIYSGLPWAGAAVLATVLARFALLRLLLNASDMSARQTALLPLLRPLNEKLRAAKRNKDQAELLQVYKTIKATKHQYGVKMRTMFAPMLIQIPMGYATFRLTKKMAALPVPGLDTSHFLWISDLTVPDPIWGLPILAGSIMYFTLKRGGEMGVGPVAEQKAMATAMKYIFPAITLIFISNLPALTQIMFTTTTLIAFLQTKAFANAAFREWAGIQPLPTSSPSNRGTISGKGSITQYKSPAVEKPTLWERLNFWRTMRSKAEEYQAQNRGKAERLTKAQRENAERYEKQRRNEIEAEIVDRERARRRLKG